MHSENLLLLKRVEDPTEKSVGKIGLVSERYPSDHLSLYCEFCSK